MGRYKIFTEEQARKRKLMYQKEYSKRPSVVASNKKYKAKYRTRPNVKKRQAEYMSVYWKMYIKREGMREKLRKIAKEYQRKKRKGEIK